MGNPIKRLKYACYTTNISMAIISNMPPVLFITFRELYGISYSLLGLLVLINFSTQLIIDLIFSFFSHRFNIPKVVKMTPILTVIGLGVFALWPMFLPEHAYAGLVVGSVIAAASAGFCEVLISPVIAAIPSDDPDREMSKLHSIYAWGVVGVIPICTLFLLFVGGERWHWLALAFIVVPLSSAILFSRAQIPHMETPKQTSGALRMLKNGTVWACVAAIFLGGSAECTMAQWSSGYLEQAMGIPKIWGDMFGVALFAVMLGLGRTLYAKRGRCIGRVMTLGFAGAAVCYLLAALTSLPLVGLLACAVTGFCTSMLWPGSLIVASDRVPQGGVFIYAMMAAGGDLGASVGPQLIGLVTDATIASPAAAEFAAKLALSPDQLGMKLGMLVGMLFPLIGAPLALYLWKGKRKRAS